jgi:hypothetical protein
MYVPQKLVYSGFVTSQWVKCTKTCRDLSKGKRDTVPDHIVLCEGTMLHVWCRWTIVVPSTARVVPVSMIVVSPSIPRKIITIQISYLGRIL